MIKVLIAGGVLITACFVTPVVVYLVRVRLIQKKHDKIVDDFFRSYDKF